MLISDDIKLKEIRETFSAKFPYLKLEFYNVHHVAGEGSPPKQLLDVERKIGDVRSVHNTGELQISGNMKVRTLVEEFYKKYGLNVQVFRKSGDLWLQTISTDDWTLSEQNRRGETFSTRP